MLASNIASKPTCTGIEHLIAASALEEAAQEIEAVRGTYNLEHDLIDLFSMDKLQKAQEQLPRQAAYLLPLLFPSSVTTNYDAVLERVYQEHGVPFARVLHPGHHALVEEMFGQGRTGAGLFKIHGDISGGMTEYDSIIFTKKQYERWYCPGSALLTDLQICFAKRKLLFLGCSLETDRTVDFLRRVTVPGMQHYAILECKADEGREAEWMDQRARELAGDQASGTHIRAIFYPKKQHGAVRVILEKLLEDTSPEEYQRLAFHIGAPINRSSNRFDYDAETVQLQGRGAALEALRKFCFAPNAGPMRWWIITGPGGAGKSRLAYEFSKECTANGWDIISLNHSDYRDLMSKSIHLRRKTLVIADYTRAYARELGRWFEELLLQPHSVPLRILLVERIENKTQEKTLVTHLLTDIEQISWIDLLLSEVRHSADVMKLCFQDSPLELPPLRPEELIHIMQEYTAHKRVLDEPQAVNLLDTLNLLDPELCRPLYALFIADAWMNGNSPKDWNKIDVLNDLIKRENIYRRENLKQQMGSEGNYQLMVQWTEQLTFLATLLGDATFSELKNLVPELWQKIEQEAKPFASCAEDFLWRTGISAGGIVPALRPDLLGEYFICHYFLLNQDSANTLTQIAWKELYRVTPFYFRLIPDYQSLFNENDNLWTLITLKIYSSEPPPIGYLINLRLALAYCHNTKISMEMLYYMRDSIIKVNDEIFKLEYARGLVNYSLNQSLDECYYAVSQLKTLTNSHPDNTKFLLYYATGIYNLSRNQQLKESVHSINQLKTLSDTHTSLSELRLTYAKGLSNMTLKQDLKGRACTAVLLKNLYTKYPDDIDIALQYAGGLVNLSILQDMDGCAATVKALIGLKKKYFEKSIFELRYASGLVNLSMKQDLIRCEHTLTQLKSLADLHSDDSAFASKYAKGCYNLLRKQNLNECTITMNQLRHLAETYPNSPEIALQYSSGLFLIHDTQGLKEYSDSVRQLESLFHRFDHSFEFALNYAKGLVNLIIKQDLEGSYHSLNQIKELLTKFNKNNSLLQQYASGIVNLSRRQDLIGCIQSVNQLKNIMDSNVDNIHFVQTYASGLVNLSGKQNLEDCFDSLGRLKILADTYPENPELLQSYAKGLVNLSKKQDLTGCLNTVKQIKLLSEAFPSTTYLSLLSSVLVNLSHVQNLEDRLNTVDQIKKLADTYPGHAEFYLAYAKGLVNLIFYQNLKDAATSVEQLKSIVKLFPDHHHIVSMYARGIVDLCSKQNLNDCSKSLSLLKGLTESYPNISSIKLEYAKGLVNLSYLQNLENCIHSVNVLNFLMKDYPNSSDFALHYACGLVNLSNKQDLAERQHSVNQLKKLAETYSNNGRFDLRYARGLVNLSLKQELSSCSDTVKRLQQLAESYSGDSDFALEYAKGLVCIMNKQNVEACSLTLKQLMALVHLFENNSNIVAQYARALSSLSFKQDLDACKTSVNKLEALVHTHPDNHRIAISYGEGLVNLSSKHDLVTCSYSVQQLKNLKNNYPLDKNIAYMYSTSLMNLTIESNLL